MIDIQAAIKSHQETISGLPSLEPLIRQIAEKIVASLKADGKVVWMGNGGSAADSQHLAAELVGRYTRERPGLASIALTTNTSILTAVANDYSYDDIFSRQIEALCTDRDVVVGLSTSGNSANVLAAISRAREMGAFTVAFSGRDGGQLADLADMALTVPASDTARIQEAHILVGHIICDWVEAEFSNG